MTFVTHIPHVSIRLMWVIQKSHHIKFCRQLRSLVSSNLEHSGRSMCASSVHLFALAWIDSRREEIVFIANYIRLALLVVYGRRHHNVVRYDICVNHVLTHRIKIWQRLSITHVPGCLTSLHIYAITLGLQSWNLCVELRQSLILLFFLSCCAKVDSSFAFLASFTR